MTVVSIAVIYDHHVQIGERRYCLEINSEMLLLERERRERGVGRVAREGEGVARSRCQVTKCPARLWNGLDALLLLDLEICYRTRSIKGYIEELNKQ